MSNSPQYWSYIFISWLIIGHTYGIIQIYKFGVREDDTKTEDEEIKENETIYKYLRLLKPLFGDAIPDAQSGIQFYRNIRKGAAIFLIISQTIATIAIAIVIKTKV